MIGKIRYFLLRQLGRASAPDEYREMVKALKKSGIFDVLSGVIVGKPIDNLYAEEYKQILIEVIDDPNLPIVFNINIGHATPRAIIPFGVKANVDTDNQIISFEYTETSL